MRKNIDVVSQYRCGVSPAGIHIIRELGIFNITYVFHELTYMFHELDHLNITNSINCRYSQSHLG